jgi:hypothetical protein
MKTATGNKCTEKRTERMKTFLGWWDCENKGAPGFASTSAHVGQNGAP